MKSGSKCTDCTRCPYKYCINEDHEPAEKADRTEYLAKWHMINRDRRNEAAKERYKFKKRNGICVRCENKATYGIYCYDCYIKEHQKTMHKALKKKNQRHDRGLVPEIRRSQGLCLWCGEKATGDTNACDRHRKIFQAAVYKSKGREYFARLEKARIEELENDKVRRV